MFACKVLHVFGGKIIFCFHISMLFSVGCTKLRKIGNKYDLKIDLKFKFLLSLRCSLYLMSHPRLCAGFLGFSTSSSVS